MRRQKDFKPIMTTWVQLCIVSSLHIHLTLCIDRYIVLEPPRLRLHNIRIITFTPAIFNETVTLFLQTNIFLIWFMYYSINIADCYNISRIRKSPVWIWKLFIKSINFVWTFGTRNTFKSFWWSSDWLIGSSLNFDDTCLLYAKVWWSATEKVSSWDSLLVYPSKILL